MKKILFILVIIMLLSGCAIEGKVYVSIQYANQDQATNTPAVWTPDITGLPATLAATVTDRNYAVVPGTYTVSLDWGGGLGVQSRTVDLSPISTIMGMENRYFEILLTYGHAPLLIETPGFY